APCRPKLRSSAGSSPSSSGPAAAIGGGTAVSDDDGFVLRGVISSDEAGLPANALVELVDCRFLSLLASCYSSCLMRASLAASSRCNSSTVCAHAPAHSRAQQSASTPRLSKVIATPRIPALLSRLTGNRQRTCWCCQIPGLRCRPAR